MSRLRIHQAPHGARAHVANRLGGDAASRPAPAGPCRACWQEAAKSARSGEIACRPQLRAWRVRRPLVAGRAGDLTQPARVLGDLENDKIVHVAAGEVRGQRLTVRPRAAPHAPLPAHLAAAPESQIAPAALSLAGLPPR